QAQLAAMQLPHFGLFVFAPPAAQATILGLVLLTLLAAAALALLGRKLRDPRIVSGLAAVYCAALVILFAVCARNDAAHLEPWRPLIAANRARPASGALEAELQAMKAEYIYLRRTGRDAEAEETRLEAAAMAAEHGTTLH
ncbi:MAG TPA: hypothetical protein VN605_06315, partial [Thermoanaerobaculia bacterium]|nr:hypothetical protein [Thermoanaerobaculia bacterium]